MPTMNYHARRGYGCVDPADDICDRLDQVAELKAELAACGNMRDARTIQERLLDLAAEQLSLPVAGRLSQLDQHFANTKEL